MEVNQNRVIGLDNFVLALALRRFWRSLLGRVGCAAPSSTHYLSSILHHTSAGTAPVVNKSAARFLVACWIFTEPAFQLTHVPRWSSHCFVHCRWCEKSGDTVTVHREMQCWCSLLETTVATCPRSGDKKWDAHPQLSVAHEVFGVSFGDTAFLFIGRLS